MTKLTIHTGTYPGKNVKQLGIQEKENVAILQGMSSRGTARANRIDTSQEKLKIIRYMKTQVNPAYFLTQTYI